MDVLIYTTRYCPFCIRAKVILESKGVKYREIAVDYDPELRREMTAKAGRRTVPQIWINQKHIGGCHELMHLDHTGELDQMLASPP